MLADTRAELDEFQRSSRELEDELVRELEHNEKVQQDLRVKVSRTENERDDWKVRSINAVGNARSLMWWWLQIDKVHATADNTQYHNHIPPARTRPTQTRTSATQSSDARVGNGK